MNSSVLQHAPSKINFDKPDLGVKLFKSPTYKPAGG
jgi:hypothetical protein